MTDHNKSSLISHLSQLDDGFLIGTASSAHQVEGGNHNDWTEFEKIPGNIKNNDVSGKATNHYELFKEDFKQLSELGFKAHRLSIEWSRIYPEPDKINFGEIEHYKEVLQSMRDNNLVSFVTLHHFTSPQWFIKKGGFVKKSNLKFWEDFVDTISKELGDYIDVFNTINEPYIYASTAYLDGIHAPGEKSVWKYLKVGNNLMRAHFYAVEIIRNNCPNKPVGIVKNLIHFKKKSRNPINYVIKLISDMGFNKLPIRALRKQTIPFGFGSIKKGDIGDFVGINYYVKSVVGVGLDNFVSLHEIGEENLTQMGWGSYPRGMYREITRFNSKINLPIFITENGIATDDDHWRIEFINDYLAVITELIDDGIDIRGYLHWSSIDNFEWAEGFYPKFGLISYDEKTYEREPKPSAKYLGDIADAVYKENHNLLEL